MKKLNFLFWVLIIIGGCGCPPPPIIKSKPICNFIIVLDLSDRIIKDKVQIDRDKEIIAAIYEQFNQRVKKNLYIKSKDLIKVVIAEQANSEINSNEFEKLLFINMGNIPIKDKKIKENERKKDFLENIDKLYDLASKPKKFTGADISKYFRADLKRDIEKNDSTNNFIFVLTDGCMYVKGQSDCFSGWDEPISKYENSNVIVLETVPNENNWDCMQKAWIDWLGKMNFDNIVIEKKTAVNKIEQLMASFIEGKGLAIGYNTPDNCTNRYSPPINKNPTQTENNSIPTKTNENITKSNETITKLVVNEPVKKVDKIEDVFLRKINKLIESKEESMINEIVLLAEKGTIAVSVYSNGKREDMTLNTFLKNCKMGNYEVFKTVKNVLLQDNKVKKIELEK